MAQELPGLSGGVTLVAQLPSDGRIRPEAIASLDVFADVPMGPMRLHVYAEAGTTRFRDGVARLVPEANTDAGTALDASGGGRVQLSEARLVWPLGGVDVHAGLLDATGFLDVSRIANDENLFFMAAPFVNNPTIAFPDYAVGAAAHGALPVGQDLELGAVLTSSHGLADNQARSYGHLVDVTAAGKGVFAGAMVRWNGRARRISVGGWRNTAAHARLDGSGEPASNHGVFAVLSAERGRNSLSMRLGSAYGAVSPRSGFVGLTYLWAAPVDAVGLALGRSFASGAAVGSVDSDHIEMFMRRRFVGRVFVTWSIQHLSNPGLDGSGTVVDSSLWIGGVRLSTRL